MSDILKIDLSSPLQTELFCPSQRDFYSRLYLHFIFPEKYNFRNKIFYVLNIPMIRSSSFGVHMTLWQGISPLCGPDEVCEKLTTAIPPSIEIQIGDIFESQNRNIIAKITNEQAKALQRIAFEMFGNNGNYPFPHCTLAKNISSSVFVLQPNTLPAIQEIFTHVTSAELIYRYTN